MEKEPQHTQTDDDRYYNCADDSDPMGKPEPRKIDVITPAHLPELGTGAARALLHLIVEAHRRKTTNTEHSTEDI